MIEQTEAQRAAQIATNAGLQANNIVKMHLQGKTTGFPAQGNLPAVSAAAYVAASGTAQITALDAFAAANPQT